MSTDRTDRTDNLVEEFDLDLYGLKDMHYVNEIANGRDVTIDSHHYWDFMLKRFVEEDRINNYKRIGKDLK